MAHTRSFKCSLIEPRKEVFPAPRIRPEHRVFRRNVFYNKQVARYARQQVQDGIEWNLSGDEEMMKSCQHRYPVERPSAPIKKRSSLFISPARGRGRVCKIHNKSRISSFRSRAFLQRRPTTTGSESMAVTEAPVSAAAMLYRPSLHPISRTLSALPVSGSPVERLPFFERPRCDRHCPSSYPVQIEERFSRGSIVASPLFKRPKREVRMKRALARGRLRASGQISPDRPRLPGRRATPGESPWQEKRKQSSQGPRKPVDLFGGHPVAPAGQGPIRSEPEGAVGQQRQCKAPHELAVRPPYRIEGVPLFRKRGRPRTPRCVHEKRTVVRRRVFQRNMRFNGQGRKVESQHRCVIKHL